MALMARKAAQAEMFSSIRAACRTQLSIGGIQSGKSANTECSRYMLDQVTRSESAGPACRRPRAVNLRSRSLTAAGRCYRERYGSVGKRRNESRHRQPSGQRLGEVVFKTANRSTCRDRCEQLYPQTEYYDDVAPQGDGK